MKTLIKTLFICLLICLLTPVFSAESKSVDIKITGDFELEISGTYYLAKKPIKIKKQTIEIDKNPLNQAINERYVDLGEFKPDELYWRQGVALKSVSNGLTGSKDTLVGDSVVVKGDKDGKKIYVKGKDYQLASQYGFIGRLENGISEIKPSNVVYIDYSYYLLRIDTVAVNTKGKLLYFKGTPHIQTPEPPVLPKYVYPVVNVFLKEKPKLTTENLYPITELKFPEVKQKEPLIKSKLPRTYNKLINGEDITILFWGDSVTFGMDLKEPEKEAWHRDVLTAIKAKYPKAKIKDIVLGWPGVGVPTFIDKQPWDGAYTFDKNVLGVKPDLVVMEFVNDTYQYIPEDSLNPYYQKVKDDFAKNNIDWIIMAPHFNDADVRSFNSERYKASQRWYDAYVKKLANANPNILVADSSIRWEHLEYQGIPFLTLMVNGGNHPTPKGHQILADGVIALF